MNKNKLPLNWYQKKKKKLISAFIDILHLILIQIYITTNYETQ